MWLYRAYSGNLYHGGEQSNSLPGYTDGDLIVTHLDMDKRELWFGKNREEPILAFSDLPEVSLFFGKKIRVARRPHAHQIFNF